MAELEWANDNYKEFMSNKVVEQEKIDVIGHKTKEDLVNTVETKTTNPIDGESDWLAELVSKQTVLVTENNNIGIIDNKITPKQQFPRKIDGSSYVFLNDCNNVLIDDNSKDTDTMDDEMISIKNALSRLTAMALILSIIRPAMSS